MEYPNEGAYGSQSRGTQKAGRLTSETSGENVPQRCVQPSWSIFAIGSRDRTGKVSCMGRTARKKRVQIPGVALSAQHLRLTVVLGRVLVCPPIEEQLCGRLFLEGGTDEGCFPDLHHSLIKHIASSFDLVKTGL